MFFRKQIIEYFVQEYMEGRTPVPCTLCNNCLKWPLLAKVADEMGIFLYSDRTLCSESKVGRYLYIYITHAADPDKDQSFFSMGVEARYTSADTVADGEYYKS